MLCVRRAVVRTRELEAVVAAARLLLPTTANTHTRPLPSLYHHHHFHQQHQQQQLKLPRTHDPVFAWSRRHRLPAFCHHLWYSSLAAAPSTTSLLSCSNALTFTPRTSPPSFFSLNQIRHQHAVTAEPCNGPDQVLPATSLKSWSSMGTVQLQLTESGPASVPPVSVYSQLKRAATHYPTHHAMAIKRDGVWKYWSYEEYLEQSCTVARALIKLGVERYHGVCISGSNCPEWFIANFGAIFAGGISAGLYPSNSQEACVHVALDCRAQVIIVDDVTAAKKMLSIKHKLPLVKAIVQWEGELSDPGVLSWQQLMDLGRQQPHKQLQQRLSLQAVNQCCTLIYTSGTTGPSKGVMCSQDGLTWCGGEYAKIFELKMGKEYIVSYLPLSHVAGQMTDIYVAVAAAGLVYFGEADALKGSLIHTLREVQPTAFLTVPRLLEKMQEQVQEVSARSSSLTRAVGQWARQQATNYYLAMMDGRKLNALGLLQYRLARALVLNKIKLALGFSNARNFLTASAPATEELINFYLSIDVPIGNAYALSETHSNGTLCSVTSGCYRSGSIGKPVKFARISVQESAHTSGNIPNEGEICFKGRNVFMGYLNSEKNTNETILDNGWMRTGDLGWQDSDGFLYMTGRAKELLVTAGGENVAPVPIEGAVKAALPHLLASAMLVGDRRKYLSLLLTVQCERDPDSGMPLEALTPGVLNWLAQHGSQATTVAQLRQEVEDNPHGGVATAIQAAVDKYNTELATTHVHQVRRWTLLPNDFSFPTGELNNTLKLKRSEVVDKYSDLIDTLYSPASTSTVTTTTR